MVALTFQTPDQTLTVDLAEDTVEPLMGAIRIASPALAEKVQDGLLVPLQDLVLDDREVEMLAAVAKSVSNSFVEDPALDQLASL